MKCCLPRYAGLSVMIFLAAFFVASAETPITQKPQAVKGLQKPAAKPAAPTPPQPTAVIPFSVTTEKLTVTGKTAAPASSPFTPVIITTDKLTVTGKANPPSSTTPFTPVTITTDKLTVTGK